MAWTPERYRFRDEQAANECFLPFDDVYEHVGGSLNMRATFPPYNLPHGHIELKSVKTGQRVGWVYVPFLVRVENDATTSSR